MRLALSRVGDDGIFAPCLHLHGKVTDKNLLRLVLATEEPFAAAALLLHFQVLDLKRKLFSRLLFNVKAQLDICTFANDLSYLGGVTLIWQFIINILQAFLRSTEELVIFLHGDFSQFTRITA